MWDGRIRRADFAFTRGAFGGILSQYYYIFMTAAQIRQSFLDFFQEKGHTIVPSASLLPQSPGLLFTNAGMNQFVPYFLGVWTPPWTPARASDTQKCIRAGGKHNDLEDVGYDSYHHTFFEMLGNWSFGDYFKKEAIAWAWELIVERWGFPPARLYATVYAPGKGDPGEFDREAWECWAELFRSKGLNPDIHIVNGNVKDNFWMMGETGPCGPCSELHVDLTPEGATQGRLVNKDSDQCIEIWNLVFIQYNAESDGTFRNLPARHVDTGMGFERAVAMMECTKNFTDFTQRISNYATGVFRPIFRKIEELSGKKYVDIYPQDAQSADCPELAEAIAFRVIADHLRTLSFSIADGILPGNNGRNYVLRRILRRAVRYGRRLGFLKPFMADLVDTLTEEMGAIFPELEARCEKIKEVLQREEASFNETLDRGMELFDAEVAARGRISGEFAFKLYDTYGFPIDLTALIAKERGLEADTVRFEELMEEQRCRARAARKSQTVRALDIHTDAVTQFVGDRADECTATVLEIHEQDGYLSVITDQTPFYAEMGGQIADTGHILIGGETLPVIGVQQTGKARAHLIEADADVRPTVGETVTLRIDAERRRAIESHHSATHLLHRALRQAVSDDIAQQGSLVADDRLRFDINSAPISKEKLREVEELVNQWIKEDLPVICREVPFAEIKGNSAVCQFFGDKYGDVVRVVQMGGEAGQYDGVSMELCGGTHVRHTGEIGFFKIRSEGAISSGVRRIEAGTGAAGYQAVIDHVKARLPELQSALEKLTEANGKLSDLGEETVPIPANAEHPAEQAVKFADIRTVNRMLDEYDRYGDTLVQASLDAEKRLRKACAARAAAHADALLDEKANGENIVFMAEGGVELLTELLNGLKKKQYPAAAFFVIDDGKALQTATYCGATARTGGLHAGNLLRALVTPVGGKGGGKDEQARGSVSDRARLEELLLAAHRELNA